MFIFTYKHEWMSEVRVFHWPHDRLAGLVCMVELLVPVGQESIALADNIPDNSSVLRAKQPRLTSGSVQVSMCTEERLVGASLVPAHQQLSTGSLKEATNISYGRRGMKKCNGYISNMKRLTIWQKINIIILWTLLQVCGLPVRLGYWRTAVG